MASGKVNQGTTEILLQYSSSDGAFLENVPCITYKNPNIFFYQLRIYKVGNVVFVNGMCEGYNSHDFSDGDILLSLSDEIKPLAGIYSCYLLNVNYATFTNRSIVINSTGNLIFRVSEGTGKIISNRICISYPIA